MTDQSTLFDQNNTPADDKQQQPASPSGVPENTNPATPAVDQNSEKLAMLEKRLNDSQQFIEQLKSEGAEMREELQKRITAEQVLEHVKSKEEQTDKVEKPEPGLDLDAISDLVKNQVTQTMTEAEAAKTVSQNQDAFTKALVGKYGEKAEEVYNQFAKEAGLAPGDLDKLVGKSATAGLKMFGLTSSTVQSTAPSTGSVTTEQPNQTLSPQAPADSKSHWDKVRKSDPSYYYSQKGQTARWNAIQRVGSDKFNQS